VYAFALVAVPHGVVIETSRVPAEPGGVTAVTFVALTTVTPMAATPPTVTEVVPVRFVPVIVMVVPPATGPATGATLVIVGGAT
jgi:hypothetical protein